MSCIRTGAYIFLPQYGCYGPADLHTAGNAMLIRANPATFETFTPQRSVTHVVTLDSEDYMNKRDGTLFTVASNVIDVEIVQGT